jgi:hypothetical protein
MQKGSRFSDGYDLFQPDKNGFGHHEGKRTLMKRRIGITVHVGALMDSIILRSAGFSGCEAWRKPRLSTSSH